MKFLRAMEKSAKVFTFYVKTPQSFYVLRKTFPALAAAALVGCSQPPPPPPELPAGQ